MPDVVDDAVADMPEEIALPRENGELVFASPWEARVFGVAVALHERGAFEWKRFSQTLAEVICTAERDGESSTYYERWLQALKSLTTGQGLLDSEEILHRSEQVKEEEGHAHDHEHE